MRNGNSTAGRSTRGCVILALTITVVGAFVGLDNAYAQGGPEDVVYLSEEDWAGLPEIEPVWILEVRGDSAHIVRNGFLGEDGEPVPGRSFPIGSVLAERSGGGMDDNGRRHFYMHSVYLEVRADGSLKDPEIEWHREPPAMDEKYGAEYTPARKVLRVWTDMPRTMQVHAADGRCLTDHLGYDVTYTLCFDPAERIAGFATKEIDLGQSKINLHRMLVLDYDGQMLYETDWTECKYRVARPDMKTDENVLWLEISGCYREGKCMLRLDEGLLYSLEGLPQGSWAFANNGRHVAVYNRPRFCVFDLSDPETSSLLSTIEISGMGPSKIITRAELSNHMHLLAYGPLPIDNTNTPQPHFNVFDPASGTPLARLVKADEKELVGPIAFVGDFLFCGTGFGGHGFMSDTKYIHLYDLRELVGDHN